MQIWGDLVLFHSSTALQRRISTVDAPQAALVSFSPVVHVSAPNATHHGLLLTTLAASAALPAAKHALHFAEPVVPSVSTLFYDIASESRFHVKCLQASSHASASVFPLCFPTASGSPSHSHHAQLPGVRVSNRGTIGFYCSGITVPSPPLSFSTVDVTAVIIYFFL